MANKLVTTGTNDDPVETTRNAGEGAGQWVARHRNAILSAGVSGQDTLTTTWNEGECEAETERGALGDTLFVGKHGSDIQDEFGSCAPD